MEDHCRIPLQDSHLASRKAEDAALRRYQAAAWLETLVGPLGLSNHPSELEFLSCLRNGLVLCNAINKIQPGSVLKVVDSHSPTLASEFQPLPAYQYFENVRNFIVAVEELKLPAFEASDLGRVTMEAGSTAKIVDCILSLKYYHEWKQYGSSNGSWKYARSPLVFHSSSRMYSRTAGSNPAEPCRRLDMSVVSGKQLRNESESPNLEDSVNLLGEVIADCLCDYKENLDTNLRDLFRHGNQDAINCITKLLKSCLQEQRLNKLPELQLKSVLEDLLMEGNNPFPSSISLPAEDESTNCKYKRCNSCSRKGSYCNHWKLLEAQERDLLDIKALLSRAKEDFKTLELQLQNDLTHLGSQVQGLSEAALGYHQVVKENRNLYNMLQDLKGNIRVYCRIKPTFGNDIRSTIDYIGDDGSLIIVDPLKPQRDSYKFFQFNRIFGPSATQEEVFKDTRPLIRSVMDGYNVCIFAYGQTGSGKTHTMYGPPSGSSKDMGINYLALNDLFQISCNRKDALKYEVRVQMVEVYNEQVRDLLSEDTSTTKLEIRNCTSSGGLSLQGANMHLVQSTTDILNLMKLGETNRVVSSTSVNNQSSRSHSILTVHVEGKEASGRIIRSCLHLVDLAGSERVDKSEVTGDRLKEAQHINKSLSCLGDVITALAQKNSHIPYRNSKLTQLLQYSLGGHAKTLMFAHVSPEADSYGETISTLKFAQRVSTVELGAACMNKESSEVQELKEQVETLKKALARKEEETTMQSHNLKKLKSPIEKSKFKPERTPPRPRRLSIENPSFLKNELTTNPSDNKRGSNTSVKPKLQMEHMPTRFRRLSLEGPKDGKDQLQSKKPNDVHLASASRNGIRSETCIPSPSQSENQNYHETEANNTCFENCSNMGNESAITEVLNYCTPTPKTTSQSLSMMTKSRSRIPQLTKTPEPASANKLQLVNSCNMNKKGSQIRKSIQSIGKLIHGSEKRVHQLPLETCSPVNSKTNINIKSPTSATNARMQRRQSITGVQPPGLDTTSRRSSLGGRSTDSYSNGARNARTPPPVHPSAKMTRPWV